MKFCETLEGRKFLNAFSATTITALLKTQSPTYSKRRAKSSHTVELAEVIRNFYVLDNAYIKNVDHHLFEDAIDLAERTHKAGKRQVVVTNRPHGTDRGNGSPRNLVENSRLSNFVSDILCGDDSGYRKPYREFLEARFGSDLTELGKIIVIGDQFVDAEFAHNIGCPAILVSRTEKLAHLDRLNNWEEYVQIVSSLREVKVSGILNP
jgi:phosphoglycolate phosphatase-like HAD superfamily hydrolase